MIIGAILTVLLGITAVGATGNAEPTQIEREYHIDITE